MQLCILPESHSVLFNLATPTSLLHPLLHHCGAPWSSFTLNCVLRNDTKRGQENHGFIEPVLSLPRFLGFLGGSDSKESACNMGDLGLIPGQGRPGEGNGYPPPPQYSGLENSMDYSMVSLSQTPLSNFHFHHPLKA